MIPDSYFFATTRSGKVLFCRSLRKVSDGTLARCLNFGFDILVPDDGRFRLPRTVERCEVQLITSKLPCSEMDHSAAIAYYLKRKAIKSAGVA